MRNQSGRPHSKAVRFAIADDKAQDSGFHQYLITDPWGLPHPRFPALFWGLPPPTPSALQRVWGAQKRGGETGLGGGRHPGIKYWCVVSGPDTWSQAAIESFRAKGQPIRMLTSPAENISKTKDNRGEQGNTIETKLKDPTVLNLLFLRNRS